MKTTSWLAGLMLASAITAGAATNDIATVLQRGLFEEEANRNLEAAIQAYQSVASQFDKDRRLAATAIYRLGECYRKQGNTNAATTQFERIVREFSDQSALVTLSQQNLAAFGVAATAPATPVLSSATRQEQKRLLEEEIKLVEKQLDQQVDVNGGPPTQGQLLPLQRDLLKLKRQLAALESGQPVDLAEASPLKNKVSELTSSEAEEVKRIQALIKDSPDLINAASGLGGTTPLHRAALAGQLVVAQFLLANGADTEAKDITYGGRTPLHYAAAAGHKAMVELLLGKKANVNAADKDGTTPLHLAAESGYRSVVESLLARGAQVDAKSKSGSTPLLLAAAQGFKSVVELLLAHGADINAATTYISRSQGGNLRGTALGIAAQRSDQGLAEFLISKGAAVNTVNYEKRTPLSYAVENRQGAFVKLLLDAHANPNAGSLDLPLAGAAYFGDLGMLKSLLAAGADPNTNSRWHINIVNSGDRPFNPLFLAVNQRHPDVARELIAAKADPNGPGRDGSAVIFEALGDVPTLKVLLEGGADPNRRSAASGELTPLQAALNLSEGRATAVELLLGHGANPNVASKNGWSPLHAAVGYDDQVVIQLLLKKGADVNARYEDGRTPLHVAIEKGNAEVVKLLLEGGADPNARNNSGATPLDYAKSRAQLPPGSVMIGGMMIPSQSAAIPARTLRVPPGTTGTIVVSSAEAATTPPPTIADLLRQHGGLDDAPRPDAIEVRRTSTHYSLTAFTKGDDNGNRFSLAEAIGVQYALLADSPEGDNDGRSDYKLLAMNRFDKSLPYPDLAHIRIRQPAPDSKSWQQRIVDLTSLVESGACSNDVVLSWGDVVEIPEQDHALYATWPGFTPAQMDNLTKCLTRTVEITIKGQTTNVAFGPEVIRPLFNNPARPAVDVKKGTLWFKPALLRSKLVLASSDLSRVKVTRRDPVTGQSREWVVDCADGKPAPNIWLCDGDVIEVPERTDGMSSAANPSPQPDGEVLQRLQALREKALAPLPPPSMPAPFQPRTNLPPRPVRGPSPGAP